MQMLGYGGLDQERAQTQKTKTQNKLRYADGRLKTLKHRCWAMEASTIYGLHRTLVRFMQMLGYDDFDQGFNRRMTMETAACTHTQVPISANKVAAWAF